MRRSSGEPHCRIFAAVAFLGDAEPARLRPRRRARHGAGQAQRGVGRFTEQLSATTFAQSVGTGARSTRFVSEAPAVWG